MGEVIFGLLFFISLPEGALSLEIIHLLIGTGEYSNLGIKNVLRFCAAIALMIIATCVIRPIAHNVYLNNLGHVIAYIAILKGVYNYKWKDLILCVLLCNSLLIVIENLYIPYVLIYCGLDIARLTANITVLFCLSIPARIAQAGVIVLLKKFHIMIEFARNRNYYYPMVSVLIVLNLIIDVLSNLCVSYHGIMKTQDFIVFGVAIYMLIALYISILMLIDRVSKVVIRFGFLRYGSLKKELELVLNMTEKLIDENDTEAAKEFIGRVREIEFSKDNWMERREEDETDSR